MNSKIAFKLSLLFLLLLGIYQFPANGQEFDVSPLISIPGNNTNFDVIGADTYYSESNIYICWENRFNQNYSINIKRLLPLQDGYTTIISSESPNINPTIAFSRFHEGIKIGLASAAQ